MWREADMTIRPQVIEAFQADGVVCMRGVLSHAVVGDLAQALDEVSGRIHESITGYDMTRLRREIFGSRTHVLDEGAAGQHDVASIADVMRASGRPPLLDAAIPTGDGRFILDTSTWLRSAAIRRIALDSALPEIAARLLSATKVNFCDDQIFVKEPHTRERTALHQDLSYFHFAGDQGCVVWICADPADAAAGAPFYLRGSHHWGLRFAPNGFLSHTALPGSHGEDLSSLEDDERYERVSFAVEPGDVVIHHFLTVHGAGGNRTDRSRRALSLRYAGETVRYQRRPGAPEQPYHRDTLHDGDPLDSWQFPVVWPRSHAETSLSQRYVEAAP
jgi:ectoine hydroxylase-related dioxygenase (phytanoyl-CoA dioxygenase family)